MVCPDTIVASQLLIDHCHEKIGDATIADAKQDRLMHDHRYTLIAKSTRKQEATRIKNSAATNFEGAWPAGLVGEPSAA